MPLPQLCQSVCLELECLGANGTRERWDVRGCSGRRSVSDTVWGDVHPKLTPAASLGPGVQSRILALPAGSGTPSAEGELQVLLSASGNGFNLCFD